MAIFRINVFDICMLHQVRRSHDDQGTDRQGNDDRSKTEAFRVIEN
ncbi:hypothetical protein [Acinetobacter lwoffii]|nr:hypothetical protein [Acinetobacter lwoffii]